MREFDKGIQRKPILENGLIIDKRNYNKINWKVNPDNPINLAGLSPKENNFKRNNFEYPYEPCLREELIINIDLARRQNNYVRIVEPRSPYQPHRPRPIPVETPTDQVDLLPLKGRLLWTLANPRARHKEAMRRRQASTDNIRGQLLDRYHRRGIDILTQIRLIHRIHMKGNEHYLLYPDQAGRVLTTGVLDTTDRLAGAMRSPQRLSLNIHLAAGLVNCASFQRTPEFMQELAAQAEKMFPAQAVNPSIDETNIYHFASAFQYIIALIHPFYEANGRTSEDSMYILWKRRPDLASTLRYVSSNGLRSGENVNQRMTIINNGAYFILLSIAQELGIESEKLDEIKSYRHLIAALEKRGMSPEKASSAYSQAFDKHIRNLITNFTNIDYLKNDFIICLLAGNLKNSPRFYYSEASQK